MTKKLIVATFDNLDVAQRCARDLNNLAKDDGGFRIESGVMVQKDADGKLIVLKQYTESYWGTAIGAVTGGLIGLIAGPLGVVAGAAAGAGAALAGHTIEHVLDRKMTTAIEGELQPGCVALILETKEPLEYEVENVVLGYGGKLFTQPLSW
ncbi:DUF1269 domain-containing protein [Paraburkholderia susongensis]|uniref:Uncharacterized membrane protein n=1 Tax=Paraburkholderia susongensis TaxID=1515439 RepID=A0A1X7LYB4_9BURK|nr:DUF1269 domain-containing protein [Paraburkholderia susongensis]SMG58865.1 Uncharacterized membrane protein [Paraburkholderia susongensis]